MDPIYVAIRTSSAHFAASDQPPRRKMKIKQTILAATLAMMTPTLAGVYYLSNVVTGDGSADALIQKHDGSLLTGGILAMGYFPVGYAIAPGFENIHTTISNFTIVTSSAVGSFSVSLGAAKPGYVEADPFAGPIITDPEPLIMQPLYAFCGDAATLDGSSQWALKRVATIMDDVPFTYEYLANPKGGWAPNVGTIGSYVGDASGMAAPGARVYQTLQMVPEVSTALLAACGACALLRRRRW